MERIVFDKRMEFTIKFTKGDDSTSWINWEAVKVVANYIDNKPAFGNYDTGYGTSEEKGDFDSTFKENPLCEGYIKWDGCMEIHSLNYHYCGYTNILQRLVKTIYTTAKELLGEHFDDDLAMTNNLNKY